MTDRGDAFDNIMESMRANAATESSGKENGNGAGVLKALFVGFLVAGASLFVWSILFGIGLNVGFNIAVERGWLGTQPISFWDAWMVGAATILMVTAVRHGSS